ncbi:kinase-like domain-containing protein [Rhizophagus clarus]|uniref:Kinase-like domain-containing protein n=1 Tax=Rhizophagus clarus TaxID=94130 RepID=A0A8H3L1U8_9GLOM|nr:kinase-like domain-containing protein [Rhizophagus clarus]
MKLRLERCDTNKVGVILNDNISQIIHYYDPQGFKVLDTIASSQSALVYNVRWKSTSKFAIKKFIESSSKEAIFNEIYLMKMVDSHPNIIRFYGLTKLQDEKYYSLVLENAEGGTLRKYLRDDTISFKWKNQLRFAKEVASAISWLHDDVGIIHGDLHSNNILISKGTIKLADFGCSCLKGSNRNSQVQGVLPYVDPRCFETHSYRITEKSDIYSLGVLFWELTSRKSPFYFEEKTTKGDHSFIKMNIRNGIRERPVKGTNDKFVALYEKCWQHKPDVRPNIQQVISELNLIDTEINNISTPKKSDANEDLYLSD